MQPKYGCTYLDKEWSRRKLDLFPYMEGFFSLLRSRESNLKKTEKKLRTTPPATLIQFLNSEDKDVSGIASDLIQNHANQNLITAILVYSLTKVDKSDYPARAGTCLAGCLQPAVGLTYLLQFIHQFPEIKEKGSELLQYFWRTGTKSTLDSKELQQFFDLIFQAIQEDLQSTVADLGEISSLPEFLLLKEDLTIPLKVYYLVETRTDIKMAFERGLKKFGQQIRSLQKLIPPSDTQLQMLPLVLPFIGLLRLEQDREFLKQISSNIARSNLSMALQTHLGVLIEKVIDLLADPTKYVYEVLPSDLFLSE